MKKYHVIKIGSHIRPTGVDFYNVEIGEMLGDEILDTISAPNFESAWEIVKERTALKIYK